jgi:hypothetical protein
MKLLSSLRCVLRPIQSKSILTTPFKVCLRHKHSNNNQPMSQVDAKQKQVAPAAATRDRSGRPLYTPTTHIMILYLFHLKLSARIDDSSTSNR